MLQSLMRQPKRILMTVDAVGGVWRYAMDLAGTLVAQGTEVVFAGLGPEPSGAQRAEAERIGTLIWLQAPLDWMVEREEELDHLPQELAAVVGDFGVDLVHLNMPSQACGLDIGCPVVVVSHSCVVTWFHAVRGEEVPADWQWHKARNRAGFDHADAVLAPSRSHADMLERCYGPIRQLSVVHNASDETPPPSGTRCRFVLAAARWWDDGKNGRVVDEAAARTVWPIHMAGAMRGPNGQSLELRHALPLGEMPNRDIRNRMARAGVFVSSSLYEPFGLAALEAARVETPLVLADIPTYRELWDGAALFFPPRDAGALADCVNRLAEDEALRAELGRAAGLRSREFSTARQSSGVLAIYAQALTNATAGR